MLRPPERAFAPFYQTPVGFFGERPGSRKVALAVKCMVVEDSPLAVTDAAATVRARAFAIALPRAAWPYVEPPNVGEWLQVEWGGESLWTKASTVSHLPNGDIAISAVQTSEEVGGPPWLR